MFYLPPPSVFAWAICLVVLPLVVGKVIEAKVSEQYETAAISHRCAHYDPQSGKFTWNEEAMK